jgi:uncharacterized membrane protein required for colicin V production
VEKKGEHIMKSLVGVAVGVFLSIFLIATVNAAPSGSTVVQEDKAQVQKTECNPQKSQPAPKIKAKLSKRNQAKIEQAEAARTKRCVIEKSGTNNTK